MGVTLVVPLGPMPVGLLVQLWVESEGIETGASLAAGGWLGPIGPSQADYESDGQPLVAVIPEPHSAVLLLLGLTGASGFARRRRVASGLIE